MRTVILPGRSPWCWRVVARAAPTRWASLREAAAVARRAAQAGARMARRHRPGNVAAAHHRRHQRRRAERDVPGRHGGRAAADRTRRRLQGLAADHVGKGAAQIWCRSRAPRLRASAILDLREGARLPCRPRCSTRHPCGRRSPRGLSSRAPGGIPFERIHRERARTMRSWRRPPSSRHLRRRASARSSTTVGCAPPADNRRGIAYTKTKLDVDHVLASAAIPSVFPPVYVESRAGGTTTGERASTRRSSPR